MAENKLEMKLVKPVPDDPEAMPVAKPGEFSLDKFKFERALSPESVDTLQTALPHHNIAGAKDFVRLHPDEKQYWSDELCFVNVPIKGSKRETLHLVAEGLAKAYLPRAKVQRLRLALASKPDGALFLCHIPIRDGNSWNESNLDACEQAKTLWTQATSQKDEGIEAYKITKARNKEAFLAPKWPKQTVNELIFVTFSGRMIDSPDHPALLRLIGEKQKTS
jgi:hypothetical protein